MTLPWPRSLHGRLLAGLLAVVGLVWSATGWLTWRDVRHELDELLDAHLAQAAALLVVQQSVELEHDDDRLLDAPLLSRYAPRVAFQVFHEGRLVMRSAQAPRQPLVPLDDARFDAYATVQHGDEAWRVFAVRGGTGAGPAGSMPADVQVLVAERLGARAAILRAALRGVLWPLALALPLLALLAWGVVRQTVRPLRQLGTQLADRSPQALAPVAVAGLPTEVQPLAEALNGLFGRIGAMVEAERRFTADAAHELRTPVAAIRAQAQVALHETDDDTRRRALAATLAGCDRAARLIDQLLTLARAEHLGHAAAALATPIDLAAVARGVVADLAPAAIAAGHDLGLDAPATCPMTGDATLLAVLLRNLVDNALRYGPPGTRVTVSVAKRDGRLALGVDDDGPGLDAAARARLGERFFRAPVTGHGGEAATGSGLGWSIVRRIAELHGFALAVAPAQADGRGLSVRLSRPAG